MAFLAKVRSLFTKTTVKKVENVRVVTRPEKLEHRKRAKIVKKTIKKSMLGIHRSIAKRYGKKPNPVSQGSS